MPLLFILANLATAQDDAGASYLDSDLYRPPIETDGQMWTEDAGIEPDGLTHATIETNYIFDPLTETDPDNDFDSENQALRTDVIAAGAFRGVQVGIDVPVYVIDETNLGDGRTGIGDIALDLKGGVVEQGGDNPANVAIGFNAILPTTADNIDRSGVDELAWSARIAADAQIVDIVNIAGNVGTRGVPDEIVDTDGFNNQFFFRASGGVDIVEDVGLAIDVVGALDYDTPVDDLISPVHGYLGGYGTIANQLEIRGGLGSGWIPGLDGPHPRFMLGVNWMPSKGMETDFETAGGTVDECPGEAEDMDGFEDADGCPDADNDRDNVADLVDECANEAEDLDGLADDDGCPEKENRVSVQVRDDSGMVLPTARVSIEKEGRIIESGSGGTIDAQLEPGEYKLVAQDEGFEAVETNFTVYPEDTVEISATLTKSDMTPTERSEWEKAHPEDVDIEHELDQPADEKPLDESKDIEKY